MLTFPIFPILSLFFSRGDGLSLHAGRRKERAIPTHICSGGRSQPIERGAPTPSGTSPGAVQGGGRRTSATAPCLLVIFAQATRTANGSAGRSPRSVVRACLSRGAILSRRAGCQRACPSQRAAPGGKKGVNEREREEGQKVGQAY